jgi:uncharacterized protein YcbK (DUF882 family)
MADIFGRRRFLHGLGLSAAVLASPAALAALAEPRRLRFYHTHTSEKLDIVYHEAGAYIPDALQAVNHLLRDFRSGEIAVIDCNLLDILYDVQQRAGSHGRFEIISGYRSPATNAMLQRQGHGVASRSLHMQGQAIDVRLTDLATADLRRAALDLHGGGVGFYPQSDFVHLDTGRVRFW